MSACIGRYCECRYHLNPDIEPWVMDAYMPSPWAQEVLHTMWEEGRTGPTQEEQWVVWAELVNLAEAAGAALEREQEKS